MATRVHMEALSPTMEEGQVVRWLKNEGDPVAREEILAEIETDKATMELVARGEGVLRKILVGDGGVAPVGDVIAVIAAPDEDIEGLIQTAAPADSPSSPDEPTAASSTEKSSSPDASASSAVPGRTKVSPVARRLARDLSVDLHGISGTGPGGRIVKRDIEREAARLPAVPANTEAPPDAPSPQAPPVPGEDFVDVPLSQMRKTVARRLTESLGPVPHFFLTVEADMRRAMEARARINNVLDGSGKVSVNDLVVRAAAAALIRHPDCNAWWQDGFIRRFNRVHMGVAVAVPGGLITPVVRDAQSKGLARIGAEVRELAVRAREKKLQPHEYTGSTFSISNLGMFGIDEFTAVINPPEAGILAVGTIRERPVAREGQLVLCPTMRLTLSCDHRVIDGAQGARFLATLKAFLEEPAAILI